jgi:hypothetical protein
MIMAAMVTASRPGIEPRMPTPVAHYANRLFPVETRYEGKQVIGKDAKRLCIGAYCF